MCRLVTLRLRVEDRGQRTEDRAQRERENGRVWL